MKVLYITNYADMYGANRALLTMMSLLQGEYDIEPYLLISGNLGDMGAGCEKEGIPCLGYDFRISAIDENTKWKPVRRVTRRIMRYVDFYKIYRKIKMEGLHFDLVHSNSSVFDIGLFLAKKWKVPHVWHVREFAKEGCGLEIVYGKNAMKRKYAASSMMIAISDAIAESIRHLGSKIRVRKIYDGIVLPQPYNKEFIQDGILKFCIVGGLSEKKNQLDVIKACERLIQQGLYAFQLYIVGDTFGNYYEEMQDYLVDKDQLRQRVVFTGYRKDVHLLLAHMDVGVMATDIEAFGLVTVEYMSNYMTVIGTNAGGTPELLGGTGRLFKPHDIEALAQAMCFYIEHPEVLEKNKEAVRKQAELFSAEKNAEIIYKCYKEVV